jgi:NAD(P)-dependent dehydrogenase (short-subunit alcohol dehydrogenase family)
MSLISLEDKSVLITGGSRGIGAAIAHACAAAGARVVVAARKQEGLDAVATAIRAAGGDASAIACHMGKPEEIEQLFVRAGAIDVLVNNAATNPYFGPMLSISDAQFDKTVEINMKGYLWAVRVFVEALTRRGATSGAVVNIASVAGRGAAPLQGVYAMTKAAVISMTQTLAVELASSGVRVNAIAPGVVDTKFAAALVQNPAISEQVVKATPLRRVGRPEDVAGAAVYLASDAASWVTGETLVVDGGLTISAIAAP